MVIAPPIVALSHASWLLVTLDDHLRVFVALKEVPLPESLLTFSGLRFKLLSSLSD